MKEKSWKKVTPLPPEINEGYLWDCKKCGHCISWPFRGNPNDVNYKCPECSKGERKDCNGE